MTVRDQLLALVTGPDERLYKETGNGIHVWAAFVRCRQHLQRRDRKSRAISKGTLLPPFVLDYFDEVAARLLAPNGTASPAR